MTVCLFFTQKLTTFACRPSEKPLKAYVSHEATRMAVFVIFIWLAFRRIRR